MVSPCTIENPSNALANQRRWLGHGKYLEDKCICFKRLTRVFTGSERERKLTTVVKSQAVQIMSIDIWMAFICRPTASHRRVACLWPFSEFFPLKDLRPVCPDRHALLLDGYNSDAWLILELAYCLIPELEKIRAQRVTIWVYLCHDRWFGYLELSKLQVAENKKRILGFFIVASFWRPINSLIFIFFITSISRLLLIGYCINWICISNSKANRSSLASAAPDGFADIISSTSQHLALSSALGSFY